MRCVTTSATYARRLEVPLIGFIAWERVFETNPEGNYGRLIDHSFASSQLKKDSWFQYGNSGLQSISNAFDNGE